MSTRTYRSMGQHRTVRAAEFRDGLLVDALRRGCWIILDELTLAPSEVLEALNRLLNDNRELYPRDGRDGAPQPSPYSLPSPGATAEELLSRAFRNRFEFLCVICLLLR